MVSNQPAHPPLFDDPAPGTSRHARASMTALKVAPLILSIAVSGLGACDSSDESAGVVGLFLLLLAASGDDTTYGSTYGTTTGSASTGGAITGPGLGAGCNLGMEPDPCSNRGFVCTQVGATSSCQLPGELTECLGDTGCASTTPPLFCEPDFEDNDGNPVRVCVYHCEVTADCPDVYTSCLTSPKICYVNYCGPGARIVNGMAYYADCNSGGTNNGTCVPYYGKGSPGVCQAAGPVAMWQPCSDQRLGGGTSELCAKGTTCVAFPVDGAAPKTMCAPLCAPAGASVSGPSCGAGQTCFWAGSVDFGFCLADCNGGQTCPASTTCQDYGTIVTRPECIP